MLAQKNKPNQQKTKKTAIKKKKFKKKKAGGKSKENGAQNSARQHSREIEDGTASPGGKLVSLSPANPVATKTFRFQLLADKFQTRKWIAVNTDSMEPCSGLAFKLT